MRRIALASVFLLIIMGLSQSCTARQQPTGRKNGSGTWYIEFNSNDIGLVRTVLTFDIADSTFTAYSRKNADRDLLGLWTSTLGRTFTKDFKNGSLIRITDGITKQKGDTLLIAGIFRSAMGNYQFRGRIIGELMQARLTNRNQENKGQISGSRREVKMPLSDYPALVNQTLAVTNNKIFNPNLKEKSEWKKFNRNIRKVAAHVQDDLEMVFAFYYYARSLPITHYSLLRLPPSEGTEVEKRHEPNQVSLKELTATTALLKIDSFGGTAAEMDSLFSVVRQKQYFNLIVDLRNNPGGTVEAGMAFATNVATQEFYGGIFLTQKWFEKNKGVPNVQQYANLPHFTAANFDLIIEGIHKQEGLCLKVVPVEEPYTGKLYILTNSSTASTCEPIVYGLKQYQRATVVGGKTAGAMLNGEFFALADGFSVVIPTADYYTADGYRIDQNGVEPHVEVEPQKALEYVLQNLIQD